MDIYENVYLVESLLVTQKYTKYEYLCSNWKNLELFINVVAVLVRAMAFIGAKVNRIVVRYSRPACPNPATLNNV